MTEWDVYYRAVDGSCGRFAGTILHVCRAGSLVGSRMVPPRVLRCSVTCSESDVLKFWNPGYAEAGMLLQTRRLINVLRVRHQDSFSLQDFPLIDRLPAARALVALGFTIHG